MKARPLTLLALILSLYAPALANVPVNDAAILERKAQESTHKVELKSVLLDHKKKREGIKCAVTKSGRGNVQNPERQANPTTGAAAVENYAPGLPATPQQGATGGTLNEQQLGSQAGTVVSGVEATQGTITQNGEAYRGDATEPGIEALEYPALLDLPAPHLKAYAPETVIAEKFQAMVVLGQANSRMKDFYDIWVLSRTFTFDPARLSSAIQATFKRRSTVLPTDPPLGLTAAFATDPQKQIQWRAFCRDIGQEPGSLTEVVSELRAFLMPYTLIR